MSGMGRDQAPFSGRVWQEIDQAVATIRGANCTARRFLTIDGPYGLGLTSVAGDEGWLQPGGYGAILPNEYGAPYTRWSVTRPVPRRDGVDPSRVDPGTYLVRGFSRPVPLIASEFDLGIRNIEAFESGCQPLDVCRATSAARDVALEEERLIYYGYPDDFYDPAQFPGDPEALLRVVPLPVPTLRPNNTTPIHHLDPIRSLHEAIRELAARGYAGPFALTVEPRLYTALYSPLLAAPSTFGPVLVVDLLRNLFRGGVFMAPVIDSTTDNYSFQNIRYRRMGAIVTVGRAYSRLVVGQDWLTAFVGRDGVLYRFLITDSLQLRVCDHLSIQVLTEGDCWTYQPEWPECEPYEAPPVEQAPPAQRPAQQQVEQEAELQQVSEQAVQQALQHQAVQQAEQVEGLRQALPQALRQSLEQVLRQRAVRQAERPQPEPAPAGPTPTKQVAQAPEGQVPPQPEGEVPPESEE